MKALRKGQFKRIDGDFYGTPKELWGFRTSRNSDRPATIARGFLAANDALLRVPSGKRELHLQKTIRSLGATHIIFQQLHLGFRVHRAYVTVHVARDGSVYLAKNRAMPRDMLPPEQPFALAKADAIAKARSRLPDPKRAIAVQETEAIWFPDDHRLRLAWKVRIARSRPREEWIVYVNAKTGGILSKHDNLAEVTGRGRVFDPSPVTTLGDHSALLTATRRFRRPPLSAYREVRLFSLDGNGCLEGRRVTTRPTAADRRIRRADHDFRLEARDAGFEEVMVYHHIDCAIRRLERLGFRGRRRIFQKGPVEVDVNGSPEDNSWYSPFEKRLTFGTGDINDAEDGETILHELGHAIQDAICHDFGQSAEAAAMGEGFGDYLAVSFFADRKPERYRTAVMTWDGLLIGLDERLDPPALRHVTNKLSFDDFDENGDEHDNGEIWAATLWDVRQATDPDSADTLIVESHFQLDGFTTVARGARAILDADTNLYNGRHADALRRIFRRRRIGPL
jgi:hypothetical protein